MASRWVGVLALVALVATSLYFTHFSSPPTKQSLTAQAAASQPNLDSEAADKMCPPTTSTTEYDISKPPYPAKRVGSCVVPAAVQAGAAIAASECVIENLYKKPCYNLTAKLYVIGHCIAENKCKADKYMDQDGTLHTVEGPAVPTAPKEVACLTGLCGAYGGATAGGAPAVPAAPATPVAPVSASPAPTQPVVPTPPPVVSAPAPTPAPAPIDTIGNISNQPPPPTTAPINNPALPVQQPGLPVQVTNPAYTLPTSVPPVQPTIPTGSTVAVNYQPGTGVIPPSQTTFNRTNLGYSNPGSGTQVSPLIALTTRLSPTDVFSGIAGFLGGLFGSLAASDSGSSQTNVQIAINNAQPQPASSAQPSSTSKSPYTIVIVQNSPLINPGDEANLLAQKNLQTLLSLSKPAGVTAIGSVNTIGTPLLSAASSGPVAVGIGNAAPLSGVSPIDAVFANLNAAPDSGATTTALDLSWATPTAVTIGVPVDITFASIVDALVSGFKGGWAGTPPSLLQKQTALAQAQSDYSAIQAQIAAWQDLQSAGLCDTTCLQSLATLESTVWQQQARVDALAKSVSDETQGVQSAPVPGAGGLGASPETPPFVPGGALAQTPTSLVYDAQGNVSGTSVSATQAVSGVNGSPTAPLYQTSTDSAQNDAISSGGLLGIPAFITNVWQTITNWFAPTTALVGEHCSLFQVLFGRCKSS